MPQETLIRAHVRALIAALGLEAASKKLGLNHEAVLRLAAGAAVRRGSLAAAAIALGLVTQPHFGEAPAR